MKVTSGRVKFTAPFSGSFICVTLECGFECLVGYNDQNRHPRVGDRIEVTSVEGRDGQYGTKSWRFFD